MGDAAIGNLLDPTVSRPFGSSTMLRRGCELLPDQAVNSYNVWTRSMQGLGSDFACERR